MYMITLNIINEVEIEWDEEEDSQPNEADSIP